PSPVITASTELWPPLVGTYSHFVPTRCWSARVDMWMALPRPTGTLSFPGFFFASAINSVTVFTGTLGCVVRRYGENVTVVTGAISRMMSNGSFVYMLGVIERLPMSISIIV